MKLRLFQFSLDSGNQSAAEDLAKEIVPAIRALAGCERCAFFADNEEGDYGLAVFWESQEAADDAAAVISPILMKAISAADGTVHSRRLFDIYEP
jgi:quinol monooxygenase YgiN